MSYLLRKVDDVTTISKLQSLNSLRRIDCILRVSNIFDWCCFYYSVTNSLVALLEALCARMFSLDSWNYYIISLWAILKAIFIHADFFKYVSTIFMQFLGSFHNPNPGYTLENPKWAERVVTLTIRCRKSRTFQIFIHFHYAIIGVSYTQNPGYTLENANWAERVVALAIWRKKSRAFQICTYFDCAIIGVSHIERLGYTLENLKCAESVVALAMWRRKIRAFQICIHFYCAIIRVSLTEFQIIKAFQWMILRAFQVCIHFYCAIIGVHFHKKN